MLQQDLADLDEFEILEQFADNMSFCSNSSIITRGLHGLQADRILPGPQPQVGTHSNIPSPHLQVLAWPTTTCVLNYRYTFNNIGHFGAMNAMCMLLVITLFNTKNQS